MITLHGIYSTSIAPAGLFCLLAAVGSAPFAQDVGDPVVKRKQRCNGVASAVDIQEAEYTYGDCWGTGFSEASAWAHVESVESANIECLPCFDDPSFPCDMLLAHAGGDIEFVSAVYDPPSPCADFTFTLTGAFVFITCDC